MHDLLNAQLLERSGHEMTKWWYRTAWHRLDDKPSHEQPYTSTLIQTVLGRSLYGTNLTVLAIIGGSRFRISLIYVLLLPWNSYSHRQLLWLSVVEIRHNKL